MVSLLGGAVLRLPPSPFVSASFIDCMLALCGERIRLREWCVLVAVRLVVSLWNGESRRYRSVVERDLEGQREGLRDDAISATRKQGRVSARFLAIT